MERKVKNILVCYLLICFGASIILGFGISGKSEFSNLFTTLLLYIPGLTVAALYIFKLKKSIFEDGVLGLTLKGFRYWIVAPLVITSLCFLGYGASVLFNPALIQSNDKIISGLKESGFYFGHWGLGLPVIILINTILGSLVHIPTYLGQELGWRAFMQPQLLKIFHPAVAFVLSGIIWGLWRYFFIDLIGSNSSSPVLDCFLSILFCIPVGILLQYFYQKSQSIFVVVMAYASILMSVESAAFVLKIKEMNAQLYGPTGITGIAIFWMAALILVKKTSKHQKNIL